MENLPQKRRELTTEETQDAQIGLLKWELEEREKQENLDHLTGLKNRRALEHELVQALRMIRGEGQERRKQSLKEISLIFIDIDRFKDINDGLGHPIGDEVLRGISALLKESVREVDTVARAGGEELMILMPGADVGTAARKAEELRAKIEKMKFEKCSELDGKVTASFGVISSQSSTDPEKLYTLVDSALYRAKGNGRNRVEVEMAQEEAEEAGVA